MGIIIQNVTEEPSTFGPNEYELRINHKVIARFTHNREDGLAECLRRAASAAEDAKRIELQNENEQAYAAVIARFIEL